MLGFDLAQLFLGAQIDSAEPFAFAPKPLEVGFDLGRRRAAPCGLDAGEVRRLGRLDLQHFLDLVADIGQPALGAFEAFLGARRLLARRGHGVERGAGVAVGVGQRVLGFGETIGGGAARGFRRLDLADQRAALLGESARGIFKAARSARLVDAQLRASRSARRRPRCGRSSLRDRRRWRPAGGRQALPRARAPAPPRALRRAARDGPRSRRARRQVASRRRRRRQRGERALGFAARGGVVAACRQSRLGLAERREPRRAAARLAFGLRMRSRAASASVLQLAPLVRARPRPRRRQATSASACATACCLASTLAAHGLQFCFDVGKPVLAGEPAGGAGRRIGGDRETVPAPEIALARNQALAGLEQLDDARGVFARDHADLRKTPRELGGPLT